MRFLAALGELPISLLITSLALASAALPVHSTELTPENFKETIANGVWFIEHFSPYCHHCREFAPTWEKLVEKSEQDVPGIRLAQVNCAVHGDLCNANGVNGYPQMTLFRDGEIVEHYKGSREIDLLSSFIARHVDQPPPRAPEPPRPLLNINGAVLEVSETTFASTLSQGPTFVKFFAPWCGHCKKLAPVWKQLARHLQNKVNIAEVNCDDHSALCKSQGITGYPTLIYYSSPDAKAEYNGGRKLDQLKAFAEKASAAGMQAVTPSELDTHIAESEVVYLLLHSNEDTQILHTLREASSVLLGSPQIVTSAAPSLFSRFAIQPSTWALISLKDHDSSTPSSVLSSSSSPSAQELKSWLLSHRLPTTQELTQSSFQSVMNAPQAPLVVIAAVTNENKDKVAERFRDVGAKWRVRTEGTGRVGGHLAVGREVVFVWMDMERWADWMKRMYGIKSGDDTGVDGSLDNVPVVIADHQRLVYYDTDTSGALIKFTSSASLFNAVEAAAIGKIPFKNSESFIERVARYLNDKLTASGDMIFDHPLYTLFVVLVGFALLFLAIQKYILGDSIGDRDYPVAGGKRDRMD